MLLRFCFFLTGVGNVTQALKNKNMFDNTLFVVTTDNGMQVKLSVPHTRLRLLFP